MDAVWVTVPDASDSVCESDMDRVASLVRDGVGAGEMVRLKLIVPNDPDFVVVAVLVSSGNSVYVVRDLVLIEDGVTVLE